MLRENFRRRKAAKSETSSRNDRLLEEPTYLNSNNVLRSDWFQRTITRPLREGLFAAARVVPATSAPVHSVEIGAHPNEKHWCDKNDDR